MMFATDMEAARAANHWYATPTEEDDSVCCVDCAKEIMDGDKCYFILDEYYCPDCAQDWFDRHGLTL